MTSLIVGTSKRIWVSEGPPGADATITRIGLLLEVCAILSLAAQAIATAATMTQNDRFMTLISLMAENE